MKGQVVIRESVVRDMERLLTGQTDEALSDRFGISYNTWRKIKVGKPVRNSLAIRLQSRLAQLTTFSHTDDI
jgi:hypothetical protein